MSSHETKAAPGASSVVGTRVLVVDDSEANRRFAAFAAQKLGCATAFACDGDEVVAAVTAAGAAGAPFDIVLMDLVMVRACTAGWHARYCLNVAAAGTSFHYTPQGVPPMPCCVC